MSDTILEQLNNSLQQTEKQPSTQQVVNTQPNDVQAVREQVLQSALEKTATPTPEQQQEILQSASEKMYLHNNPDTNSVVYKAEQIKALERQNFYIDTRFSYGLMRSKKEGHDLLKNANLPTYTEEEYNKLTDREKFEYQLQLGKKQDALATLEVFKYATYKNCTDKQFGDELTEKVKAKAIELGRTFKDLTEEDILGLVSENIFDEYKKAVDENGLVPEHILDRQDFKDNVTPASYARLATAYNLLHSSDTWYGSFYRGFSQTDDDKEAEQKFLNSDKTKADFKEYKTTKLYNAIRHSINGDLNDSTWASTGQTLGVMYDSVAEHPFWFLGSLALSIGVGALGGPAGAMAAGAIMGTFFATDNYDSYKMQGWEKVQENNKGAYGDYSFEQYEDDTFWSNLGASALDVMGDAMFVGVGGLLGKGVTAIGESVIGNILSKSAQKTAVVAGNVLAKDSLKLGYKGYSNIVTKGLLAWTGGAVSQALTEGLQDVLVNYGANRFTNMRADEQFNEASKTFLESGSQALFVSLILGGANIAPHTLYTTLKYANAKNNLEKLTDTNVIAELINQEKELSKNGIAVSKLALDGEEGTRSMFLDKNQINDKLKENKLNAEMLPEGIKEKIKKTKDGDVVELTIQDYCEMPVEQRMALADIAMSDREHYMPKEFKEIFTQKTIDDMRDKWISIKQECETLDKEADKVRSEILQKVKSVTGGSLEEQNVIANISIAFLRSVARATGKSVKEIYNTHGIEQVLNSKRYIQEDNTSVEQNSAGFEQSPNSNNPNSRIVINEEQTLTKGKTGLVADLHEITHWYFDVLTEEAKTNSDVKAMLDNVKGSFEANNPNLKNANSKEYNTNLSEYLTNSFLAYMLSGKVDEKEHPLFKGVTDMMSDLANLSWDIDTTQTKEEQVKQWNKIFFAQYGINADNENALAKGIFQAMFETKLQTTEIQDFAPKDFSLDEIDNMDIAPEEKELLKKLLVEDLENLSKLEAPIFVKALQLNVKKALIKMVGAKSFRTKVKNLLSTLPSNDETTRKFIDKLIETSEKVEKRANEIKAELKEDPSLQVIEDNRKFLKEKDGGRLDYLDVVNSLSPAEIEFLDKQGMTVNNPSPTATVYTAESLWSDLKPKEKEDLKRIGVTDKESFIKALVRTPNITEQARVEAVNEIALDADFTAGLETDALELNQMIIKNHAKQAMRLLKFFNAKRGMGKEGNYSIRNIVAKIKQIARIDVANTKWKDANTRAERANADRANRRCRENLAKGEIDRAATENRNEVYYRERQVYLTKAKATLDKKIRNIKNFLRTKKSDLKRSYDVELLDLIRVIEAKTGVLGGNIKVSENAVEEIREIIKEKYSVFKEGGELGQAILDNLNRTCDAVEELLYKPKSDMTLREVNEVLNLIDTIKTQSHNLVVIRSNEKTLTRSEQREIVKQLGEGRKKTIKTLDVEGGQTSSMPQEKFHTIKRFMREWRAKQMTPEAIFQKLDAQMFGGFLHSHLFVPMSNAFAHSKLKYMQCVKEIQDTLHKIKLEQGLLTCTNLKKQEFDNNGKPTGKSVPWVFGGGKQTITEEILGIMYHMGTNYRELIDNYLAGDTFEQKEAMFKAWFAKMVEDGHITSEMIDHVNSVWKVFGDLEVDVAKASRKLQGYPQTKIVGRPIEVVMPNGTKKVLTGGYMPAMKNTDLSNRAFEQNASITEKVKEQNNKNPQIQLSFTKDRTGSKAPLELHIDALLSQLTDECRYAYVLPVANDIFKLLNDKEIHTALNQIEPDIVEDLLIKWVNNCAGINTKTPSSVISRTTMKLIQNTSKSMMFLNAINVLQQVCSLPAVIRYIGVGNTFGGIARSIRDFTSNPDGVIRAIGNKSEYMRVRLQEQQDGVNELTKGISFLASQYQKLGTRAFVKSKSLIKGFNDNAFILQQIFQRPLDAIAWNGAYQKMIKEGQKKQLTDSTLTDERVEQDAINYADTVVRQSFGSVALTDTALLSQENNAFLKMFSMFTSWFFGQNSLMSAMFTADWHSKDKNYAHKAISIVYTAFMINVVSAVFAEGINQLLSGNLTSDDDDDVDAAKTLMIISPFKQYLSGIAFAGKPLNNLIDYLSSHNVYNTTAGSEVLSSPLISTIQTGFDAGTRIGAGMTNEDVEIRVRDWYNACKMASIVLNVPVLVPFLKGTKIGLEHRTGELRDLQNSFYSTMQYVSLKTPYSSRN